MDVDEAAQSWFVDAYDALLKKRLFSSVAAFAMEQRDASIGDLRSVDEASRSTPTTTGRTSPAKRQVPKPKETESLGAAIGGAIVDDEHLVPPPALPLPRAAHPG
jgi:hypothetical protein